MNFLLKLLAFVTAIIQTTNGKNPLIIIIIILI
jgi:hypothetical protein